MTTHTKKVTVTSQLPSLVRYPGEGCAYQIGASVARAALVQPYERKPRDPLTRPLYVYALDPAASQREGSIALVHVPYEQLAPGPAGALFAVDISDRNGQHRATAVDLDDPYLLIQNGCRPSPLNFHFHQQMVYAVCMLTYSAFRKALGRDIAWGFPHAAGSAVQPRLQIYPFAFDNQNAWYDRRRGELHFGYYDAPSSVRGRNIPGGRIYTALSHDIIVHEVTHALLDGLRQRFDLPTSADVPAFHEGFADLIAIFQRFSYETVVQTAVRQAYRDWGGDVPLLTRLARQFGQTTTDSLDARLRDFDISTVLREPKKYTEVGKEPHDLGSILVAAVLNASVNVFLQKSERFVRLATGGTGILPRGELPHDLGDLLTNNAQKVASQFLAICVRAIDYCPPVDITFGDFLRAVITADCDLVPADPWGYREAWIDAFRTRGIYPQGVMALTEDALCWAPPERAIPPIDDLSFARSRFRGDPGRPATAQELHRQACALGQVVSHPHWIEEFGCVLPGDARLRGDLVEAPSIESVRVSHRIGPDGQLLYDVVAEIIQRRRVQGGNHPAFDFYGGATVILDPQGRIRYVIRKRITHQERLEKQRDFLQSNIAQRYWTVTGGQWTLRPEATTHTFRDGKKSTNQLGF